MFCVLCGDFLIGNPKSKFPMMLEGSATFLQQAHRNNWQQYLASLQPDSVQGWDVCVLTASDERQAGIYRRQLALRSEAGLLPTHTRFEVLADPAGERNRLRWRDVARAVHADAAGQVAATAQGADHPFRR